MLTFNHHHPHAWIHGWDEQAGLLRPVQDTDPALRNDGAGGRNGIGSVSDDDAPGGVATS